MESKQTTNFVQGDLFSRFDSISHSATNNTTEKMLSLPDGEVTFYPNFFSKEESDDFFQVLNSEIKWRQDRISIYGKTVDVPRKTAWYGNKGNSYRFSGIHFEPEPWTPTLLLIKEQVEKVVEFQFNSVLLNLYRDGKDGMSWHTDAEKELGKNPVIASVNFGGTRRFMFRHKNNKDLKAEVELTHGSFLLMAGTTQHFWQHQVPKTSKKVEPRINLTFRIIVPV